MVDLNITNQHIVTEHFVRSFNPNLLPQSWSAYPALAECSPASRGAVRPKMKIIQLTRGKIALIDDDDFERVNQFKWFATVCKNKYIEHWYAVRSVYDYSQKPRKRIQVYMHRFILTPPSGILIDHENHNGLDNQRKNLRCCVYANNSQNKIKVKGISMFKGVCWNKSSKKWQSQIGASKTTIYLGVFESEEKAALAYDEAAIKQFGPFAQTNKMMGLIK